MKLIHTKILPEYPIEYKLSEKQRATYYDFLEDSGIRDDKYPKKYQKDYLAYDFQLINKRGKVYYRLYDQKTGEPVVKNEAKVGTPRIKTIRGNDLFNQQSNPHATTKILDTIKEWFLTHWTEADFAEYKQTFVNVEATYPLALRFIYRSPRSQMQDLGNLRIFYEKAIPDILQFFLLKRKTTKDKYTKEFNPVGILPDDNVDIIARIISDYEESEVRELVLQIYQK